MLRRVKILKQQSNRSGTIVAIVAISLFVVVMGVALVYDRYWLEMAQVEIHAATEAAAMAACAELASDDLLRETVDPNNRLEEARNIARVVASNNRVVGQSFQLDVSDGADLLFGQVIYNSETGERQFLETDNSPTSVLAIGRRLRSRNNPVSLFFAGVTGRPVADVVAAVEASIDNHIVGVRPYKGAAVPALPIAILASDLTGERNDTWQFQIEQDQGQDNYAYDPSIRSVLTRDDGIAEIVLRCKLRQSDKNDFNVQLVDLGTDLQTDRLVKQIANGWTADELVRYQGELTPAVEAYQMISSPIITGDTLNALNSTIGQARICLLYDQHNPVGRMGYGTVRCIGLAAGRVMAVRTLDEETAEIIYQPAIIATRSALLSSDKPGNNSSTPKVVASHRYIYKIHRTQ